MINEHVNGRTRKPETEANYIERAHRIGTEWRQSGRCPDTACLQDFATWFNERYFSSRPATVRAYRAAILFSVGRENPEWAEYLANAITIRGQKPKQKRPSEEKESASSPDQGPAKKLKKFPPADLGRIIAHLQSGHRGEDDLLAYFLIASVATALRPSEWARSHLACNAGALTLTVLNAKHTNGRSFAKTRSFTLTNPAPEGSVAIIHVQSVFADIINPAGYRRLIDCLRKALYRVCRKLWPRRSRVFSLYSCRHQGLANMKKPMTALRSPQSPAMAL